MIEKEKKREKPRMKMNIDDIDINNLKFIKMTDSDGNIFHGQFKIVYLGQHPFVLGKYRVRVRDDDNKLIDVTSMFPIEEVRNLLLNFENVDQEKIEEDSEDFENEEEEE